MFLKNDEMKQFLLLLWAKYCKRYHIKLYDFIILDNHAHFLVQSRSAEDLGNFMRTVNSQLATMINKVFDRDSQAIKERYKSPLITNNSYLIKVMQYIWLNRYRVNKSRPDKDPYCSASWRLDPQAINRITRNDKERELLGSLLSDYENLPINTGSDSKSFVRSLLDSALAKADQLTKAIFESSHTISDEADVKFRGELLSSFLRQGPPISAYCY